MLATKGKRVERAASDAIKRRRQRQRRKPNKLVRLTNQPPEESREKLVEKAPRSPQAAIAEADRILKSLQGQKCSFGAYGDRFAVARYWEREGEEKAIKHPQAMHSPDENGTRR